MISGPGQRSNGKNRCPVCDGIGTSHGISELHPSARRRKTNKLKSNAKRDHENELKQATQQRHDHRATLIAMITLRARDQEIKSKVRKLGHLYLHVTSSP